MKILIIILTILVILCIYLFATRLKERIRVDKMYKINSFLEGVITLVFSSAVFSKEEAEEMEKEMNDLANSIGLNNPFVMIKKRGDDDVSSDERKQTE
jgi:hypothetical protein